MSLTAGRSGHKRSRRCGPSLIHGHRGGDVFAMAENLEAMPSVARCIGGNKDGFDAGIFHHRFEGGIGLGAAAGLGEGSATLGDQIGDGHDLHIRMILEAESRAELTNPIAGDAYPNFTI